jgi:hypothetical protein
MIFLHKKMGMLIGIWSNHENGSMQKVSKIVLYELDF